MCYEHSWSPSRIANLVLLMFLFADSAGAQTSSPGDALEDLYKIAAAYEVEIVAIDPQFPVETTGGKINGKKVGRRTIEAYADLFASEFSIYPPGLVKRTRIKRFVFCRNLTHADMRLGGLPDYAHDTIYLNIGYGAYLNITHGANMNGYLRRSIHHEFFHVIDYYDDGAVYRDRAWELLNPAKFSYGNGGRSAQHIKNTLVLTEKYPGFLNHYSTTGVEEDKAEIFSNMIIRPDYIDVRCKTDPVVRAKVRQMKSLTNHFCHQFDKRFWENVTRQNRSKKRVAEFDAANPR